MKRALIFSSLLVLAWSLFAQASLEAVLAEIEKNNTTLTALKGSAAAETIGNRTGIFLQNPEAEFGYLWGSPGSIGNRTDFSIRQSFDFPTAYGYRNQISALKNEQVELEYKAALYAIRLETKGFYYDIVYYNALIEALTGRVSHARQIASSYQAKFDVGETNILEYNKAQLNLLTALKELESTDIERNNSLAELKRLNGGKPVAVTEKELPPVVLPGDFEQWVTQAEENNPMLAWINRAITISGKQEDLSRAMSLPKLQAGYMRESVTAEQFQGITLGLSIPLWENKGQVKYAKANSQALESAAADKKVQYFNHLNALFNKAAGLQNSIRTYREGLVQYDNTDYLKAALDKGEISLINYINEFAFYYESVNKVLSLERDLQKVNAELHQFDR